ncbi:MAG: hypothetical protein LAT53_10605 [Idiomarina sp.]|nr:hypothetical protein [Idiomarina sp.]
MNKENTQVRLVMALQRILSGNPKRIPSHRKLSMRAVEEEANLGNGSGYHYPEVVESVKAAKVASQTKRTGIKPASELKRLREEKKKEIEIKQKYKRQVVLLKAEQAQMAAEHHQLSYALHQALKSLEEMKKEIAEVKQNLVEARRESVRTIK